MDMDMDCMVLRYIKLMEKKHGKRSAIETISVIRLMSSFPVVRSTFAAVYTGRLETKYITAPNGVLRPFPLNQKRRCNHGKPLRKRDLTLYSCIFSQPIITRMVAQDRIGMASRGEVVRIGSPRVVHQVARISRPSSLLLLFITILGLIEEEIGS